MEVCIERSKTRGLAIEIADNSSYRALGDFFDEVVTYQERWNALILNLHGKEDEYDLLKTRFENLRLPNLERLVVHYGRRLESDVNTGCPRAGILSNNSLPRLRDISFHGCVPLVFSFAGITSLDIRFGLHQGSDTRGWVFSHFYAFLLSTPTLRSLTVSILTDEPPEDLESPVIPCSVPHVTDLHLKMDGDSSVEMLETLLGGVNFPGVRSPAITTREDLYYPALKDCLECVPSLHRFPELLTLKISSRDCGRRCTYTIPYDTLPKLRRLSINAPVTPKFDASAPVSHMLPGLEELELVDCEEVDVLWVKQMIMQDEGERNLGDWSSRASRARLWKCLISYRGRCWN